MAVETRKHQHELQWGSGWIEFDDITTKYEPLPTRNTYRRVRIDSRGIDTLARYWYTLIEIQGIEVWRHFWRPVDAAPQD